MPLKHILTPINIGPVNIRNRIFFPPIDLALHREDRKVDQRYIDFLAALAQNNGVGMIISEFTAVANDQFWAPASRIDKDDFIPGFRTMVETVHQHGTRIFMQLALLGGRAPYGRAIAPSAIQSPLYPGVPEELSADEVRELVCKWREAAIRAKKIGFDGVEVHGGHTYLIGAFMSPHANRREDNYGCDFQGRMRFPTEIIQGIKEDCGKDYPVGVKFSAYEALPDGITGPLSIDIAEHLEKAGADYLHVSSSTYMLGGTDYPDVPPLFVPEGPLTSFAGMIKKRVKVPVLTVAGIATPQKAEEIVAEGKADLVGVGRAMFADQHWVSKVNAGKENEITPCIRCNVCHKKIVIDRAGAVECTVNPSLLGEPPQPAAVIKRVVVVGAGPAGLEAAITASERGHEVILYEKGDEPGGNIRLGCVPPFKQDLRRLLQHYERRLKESEVRFMPGREMSVDDLKNEGADVLVVAVGAEEYVPDIPGIESARVTAARDFYLKRELQKQSSERAVVIGAGDVGCEIAWYLALLGRSVSLIDVLPYEGWITDEHPTNRFILMEQLSKNHVQILDNAKKLEIASDFLSVSLEREGIHYTIAADLVVLATGYKKSDQFAQGLHNEDAASEICVIGDCADPRDIHWAIREGYETGIRIQ